MDDSPVSQRVCVCVCVCDVYIWAGRENFQDVGMEAGPDSPGIWSPRGLFRGKWSDPTCRSERLLSDCGLKEEAEGDSRIFDV